METASIDPILAQFSQATGLPALHFDEQGVLALLIDRLPFTLQFEEANNRLYLGHCLGTMPADPKEYQAVANFLLHRDCFFRGVGHGILGLEGDGEQEEIYYSARMDAANAEYPEFERFLLGAVDLCHNLHKALSALSTRGEETQAAAIPEPYFGMLRA